jgi:hypothetical protein
MSRATTNGQGGAGRPRPKKPRCEDCFFFRNELCALEPKEPCPTFRQWHPDGLRPPQQLAFAFRAQPAVDILDVEPALGRGRHATAPAPSLADLALPQAGT